ncbi:MAG: diguanylate cyclase domain-containing protein [Clostridia bacterium]
MADMKTIFRDNTITVTINIGIATALIVDEYFSVDRLINNADIALFKAKNNGRNRICIYNDEV